MTLHTEDVDAVKRLREAHRIQDVAWAASTLIRGHGDDQMAEFLLTEAGYDLAALERAGVDEYDLAPLRAMFAGETFYEQ